MNVLDDDTLRRKFLHWAASQPFCVCLDTCGTQVDQYGKFDKLIAVGFSSARNITTVTALRAYFQEKNQEWLFGAVAYDSKSAFESRMHRPNPAYVETPDVNFFVPGLVVAQLRDADEWIVLKGNLQEKFLEIEATEIIGAEVHLKGRFESNFSKDAYLNAVQKVRDHIREGDTYELNLAQCYTTEGKIQNPFALWEQMIHISATPFAGYGKWEDLHLLCASPERFFQLKDNVLRTQPIKGTTARKKDPQADLQAATELKGSEKERAENVMIVDLSRNDLNRVCEVGSVKVPHLFEIQSFPQVHHLVSTVEGIKLEDCLPFEAFATVFPPGSMTGAPKIRTCELIDELEQVGRGLYAGSLGYFSPGDDFDFNVIIRSLVYDAGKARMSYHVGGAITWDSDPAAEYAETLLKAEGIAKVFG